LNTATTEGIKMCQITAVGIVCAGRVDDDVMIRFHPLGYRCDQSVGSTDDGAG